MSKPAISLNISDGTSMQIFADVDVTVEEDRGVKEIHMVDLIHHAILKKVKKQELGMVPVGRYSVKVLATVVGAPEEEEDAGQDS